MLVLNQQPVEKQELDPTGVLDVVSCFPTIQGEGPFAGLPAVFVRLSGCNLQCPSCDTDYTTGRAKYSPDELVLKVDAIMPQNSNLVVLTGGEPLRQNIKPFLWRLLDKNYICQIETNGTLWIDGLQHFPVSFLTVICSPKTGKINENLSYIVNALKYVITAGKIDPLDGLPLDSLGAGVRVARPWPGFRGEVFIQPCDEKDAAKCKANLDEAIAICIKYGYRLSIQIHKIANLP